MKVTNIFTIVARDISTDAADNMTSIIKIIDQFNAEVPSESMPDSGNGLHPKPIALPFNFVLGTSWQFDSMLKHKTNFKLKIQIEDPKEINLGGPTQEHLVPEGIDKINLNINMQGFPYTKNGRYRINTELIDSEDKVLAKGSYLVKIEVSIRE